MDFVTVYVTARWIQITYRDFDKDPEDDELSFNVYKRSSPELLVELKNLVGQHPLVTQGRMADVRQFRFDEIGWRSEAGDLLPRRR